MPRLYHTKSKNGCARCRARRVKCDETRPICGGCERHQVECVYDRPGQTGSRGQQGQQTQQATPSPASASTPESNRTSRATDLADEDRDRRYRELRLLHFFTENICPALPGTCLPEVMELWRFDVPRMAFNYEPLLSAIFALSAQGMRWIESDMAASMGDLTTLRARYLETTLKEHRKGLGTLTRENADPVCMASCVLALDGIAAMRDRELSEYAPYEPPMEWLQLSLGVRVVVGGVRGLVQDNPHSKARRMMEYGDQFVKSSNADPESNLAKLAYLLDGMDEETRNSSDAKVYEDTCAYIGSMITAQQAGQHMLLMARRILVFSILVSPRFVELIEARDPLALIILAHYFAVAIPSRQLWWIGHSPAREILAISKHLGSEWRHKMSWPVEVAHQP